MPQLDAKHEKILAAARKEATACHPEKIPYSLTCPISGGLIEEPVITPGGFVYNKNDIIRWLKEGKQTDPSSREPLYESDLESFIELKLLINLFSQRRSVYMEIKNNLIQEARAIVAKEGIATQPTQEDPPLFICPISKKKIQEPVITPKGTIYDKQSLIMRDYRDENDQKLDKENCLYFKEFHEQLKTFNFHLKRAKTSAKSTKITSLETNLNSSSIFTRSVDKQEANSPGRDDSCTLL